MHKRMLMLLLIAFATIAAYGQEENQSIEEIYSKELMKFKFSGFGGLDIEQNGHLYRSVFVINPELIAAMQPSPEAYKLIKLSATQQDVSNIFTIISLICSIGTLGFEVYCFSDKDAFNNVGKYFPVILLSGLGVSILSLIPSGIFETLATGNYVDAVNAYNQDIVRGR